MMSPRVFRYLAVLALGAMLAAVPASAEVLRAEVGVDGMV